mmetsp:Transcript_3738/g.6754  ORF Transcript_3738/g.6754 Transcript_3738/m.6754 type:complete len:100 (+) Transcript_3738:351-650(+)
MVGLFFLKDQAQSLVACVSCNRWTFFLRHSPFLLFFSAELGGRNFVGWYKSFSPAVLSAARPIFKRWADLQPHDQRPNRELGPSLGDTRFQVDPCHKSL